MVSKFSYFSISAMNLLADFWLCSKPPIVFSSSAALLSGNGKPFLLLGDIGGLPCVLCLLHRPYKLGSVALGILRNRFEHIGSQNHNHLGIDGAAWCRAFQLALCRIESKYIAVCVCRCSCDEHTFYRHNRHNHQFC